MYVTEEQLKGFDSYKYSCVDTSPLANYVMHPFWNQFVKVFPKWLAPNVMTFVGFLLLVVQMGVLVYYDPTYDASRDASMIPMWVWSFSVFAQFFSHTLDGCDGKQARRTGTSSPLGELFDHGLDSWSVSFFIFNAYSVFGRSLVPVDMMLTIFWVTDVSFLLSHWEKYNTGILYLPWGYDFSQVILVIVYILTFINGQAMWRGGLFGISYIVWLKICLYGGSLFLAVPMSLYNVYASYRDGTGKNRSFYEAMLPLFSPFLCFIIYTVWISFSPSNILDANPRLTLFLLCVIFSNILSRMIVAQMSDTRCEVINAFIPLSAICAAVVLCTQNEDVEFYTIWGITIVTTLAHIHYGIVVVQKLADHFGIDVFHIKIKSD